MKLSRRGQNLVDYALLIGIIGLVLIGMEVYVRRGVQGKIKDVTDYVITSGQAIDSDTPDIRRNTTTVDSTMQNREFIGGSKNLYGDETTTTTYYTETNK